MVDGGLNDWNDGGDLARQLKQLVVQVNYKWHQMISR